MTFGTEWGWGAEEKCLARSFRSLYRSRAAISSTPPTDIPAARAKSWSESSFPSGHLRDRVVSGDEVHVQRGARQSERGGNGRKNIYRALHGSLRRLQTDYIDLYWLHAWDTVTPVEEVISTLSDLVREGKIRHYGFSDTPAWYVARAQTLAEKEGKERLIALQLEYSLVERNIEREHIPAAQELGWVFARGARWPVVFSVASTGGRGRMAAETAVWKKLKIQGIPRS